MEEKEAFARLEAARVGRLATVDETGRPHLVPLVFALADNRLYSAVDHKPKRTTRLQRLRNIATDSRVSVLVDDYSDDWSQLWWVRADGVGRIVETGPEWEHAVELLADKYSQYRGQPPTGAVVVIEISRISGWSASDRP